MRGVRVTLSIIFVLFAVKTSVAKTNYCEVCRDHTLCKYTGVGPKCGNKRFLVQGVTSADRQRIVATHNNLRHRVASGAERRGAPGPQPSAANMMRLKWDKELAKIAQRWADQCNFGHDTCRKTKADSVGQNVAWEGCLGDDRASNWPERIRSWYNEVSMWNRNGVDKYKFSSNTAHYTQVVWANTKRVGCGFARYKRGDQCQKIYVCNYAPSGNYFRQEVYVRGKPRSRCPVKSSADSNYPSLC